ncbi:helix-turn-helix domain-containing protein [Amycolatopsis antarctica]|nr:helix-turn-helix transcriptional regulator [Amycolatopsis antarctica]
MARTNPDGPASSSRDRTLSAVLRAAWERRKAENGLSMRTLAKQVDTSHSTLHRWFSGRGMPTFEDVVALATALGMSGEEKESLLELARNPGPNLVTTGLAGVSQQLAGVMELERTATAMTDWLPLSIPGMVQTRGYARAVVSAPNPGLPEAEIEHRVTLRLGRQNAILRDDPIRFTALIGLPAITARVGGRAAMTEQLRYLLRVIGQGTATIKLVPVDQDWHQGLMGPFVLYDFPRPHPSIVHLEHHRSGVFLDDRGDVEDYRALVDNLRGLALTDEQARQRIEEALDSWDT